MRLSLCGVGLKRTEPGRYEAPTLMLGAGRTDHRSRDAFRE